jgi:glycosyltransferase involved in cell wall biosynthesis
MDNKFVYEEGPDRGENSYPLISVVIPLYNKELYIKRTIDSVLSQTFPNFECIIVDSSDDSSTDIVRTYSDPRIIHCISKPRTSHSNARNVGAQKTKSDLIAFIDADDEWTSGHLEALFTLYTHYPDAGLYVTPYIKIRDNGSQKVMIFAEIPPPPWEGYISRYFRACSRGDVPIHSSSCAIRKRVFAEIGGFDENISTVGEDQHLWARIALHYPIGFTWNGPVIYHTDATGRICNEPRSVRLQDPLNLYLQEIIESGKVPSMLKSDIKSYIVRRNMMLITSLILNRGKSNTEDNSQKLQLNSGFNRKFPAILTKIASNLILTLYNSELYNFCIRIWCYFHGWHVPVIKK